MASRRRESLIWGAAVGAGLLLACALSLVGFYLVQTGQNTVRSASSTPSPSVITATVITTRTATVTATQTVTVTPQKESPSRTPTGDVVLDEWHDQDSSNVCVNVQTFYDNRSDTAVDKVTQYFVADYTPKHKTGQYPALVDGPTVGLTQTVGIPPYPRKEINWQVCAPALAALQNPPPADGTDAYMSQIGARPVEMTWTWVSA